MRARQAAGGAGSGDHEAVGGQSGGGQGDGGEGIDCALDQQDGGGRVAAGAQPEAAAGPAGAGCQALEGGPAGQPAGADEFGAGGSSPAVAAQEDGVAAAVGIERGGGAAVLEQGRGEAADTEQEVAHGGPVGVNRTRQAQPRGLHRLPRTWRPGRGNSPPSTLSATASRGRPCGLSAPGYRIRTNSTTTETLQDNPAKKRAASLALSGTQHVQPL